MCEAANCLEASPRGICGSGAVVRALPARGAFSGQPDRDMDDLALARRAQWKTTPLEQL